jgi:hypothetical protein
MLVADDGKLTDEQRIELLRGLTAEYATVKAPLPRSKKPLAFPAKGDYDKAAWKEAEGELGPAAKVGDLIQVTRVSIEGDKVLLEINGGVKSGKKWYERVEVGMGGRTQPIGRDGTPTAGTNIAVIFEKRVPPITAADFKALLKPVLDFEKRTVTESYLDTLPLPVQAAIKEKRVIEGMDREQVLLALGRPRHKTRSSVDGLETEDWVYGLPPGKISFITFNGNKVVKVKDSYAGLGGSTAETLPPR